MQVGEAIPAVGLALFQKADVECKVPFTLFLVAHLQKPIPALLQATASLVLNSFNVPQARCWSDKRIVQGTTQLSNPAQIVGWQLSRPCFVILLQ